MSDIRHDDQGGLAKSVEQGQGAVHGAASAARDNISDIADPANGEASSLLDHAKAQVGTALSDQKNDLAERIDELAKRFTSLVRSSKVSRIGSQVRSTAVPPNSDRFRRRSARTTSRVSLNRLSGSPDSNRVYSSELL